MSHTATTRAVSVTVPDDMQAALTRACRERQTTASALTRGAVLAYAARRGVTLPDTLRAQPRRPGIVDPGRHNVYVPDEWVALLAPLVTRSLPWLFVEALAESMGVAPGRPNRAYRAPGRPRVPTAARASHGALAAFLARRDAETGCGR